MTYLFRNPRIPTWAVCRTIDKSLGLCNNRFIEVLEKLNLTANYFDWASNIQEWLTMQYIAEIEFIPFDDPFRSQVNQDTLCATCIRLGLSAYHCLRFRREVDNVKGFSVIVSCSGYERETRGQDC